MAYLGFEILANFTRKYDANIQSWSVVLVSYGKSSPAEFEAKYTIHKDKFDHLKLHLNHVVNY